MYDPSVGRWLEEDPIGFAGGTPNLYEYVGNDPSTLTDPTGLTPNQADAIRLSELTQFVKAVEGQLRATNGSEPTPYQTLHAVDQALHNKGQVSQGGGQWGAGVGEFPLGCTPRQVEPVLSGMPINAPRAPIGQTGWVYLYTTQWGWIDLPHFFYAADKGFGAIGTWWGGWGVEVIQGFHAFAPNAGPGTFSSAFTFEDMPSNQLGAVFRYHMVPDQALSWQLSQFFTSIGARDPQAAPDFSTLPPTDAAYEQSQSGLGGRANAIGRTAWWVVTTPVRAPYYMLKTWAYQLFS